MSFEIIAREAGAWAWETYGKDFADKLISSYKEKWTEFNWKKAAERYRQEIYRQYATIRVLGKSDPVPLEGIFTDISVLDELTARKRFEIEELKKRFPSRLIYRQPKRENGLDLVNRPEGQRLFIFGKPGAGKSTFLKYIALQAVKDKLDRVPIFVSLKEWSDSDLELMPFLVKQFKICNFPEAQPFIEKLLEAGRAIVLFDGLDEVSQENDQRAEMITHLNNFYKQYHTNQYLITCRIAASEYIFEQFQDVEIADFNDGQIRTFVEKWFNDNPVKLKIFIEEFYKPENNALRELACIPLLLVLLCLAFDANISFPHRRAELYEDALDALLRRWDTSRNIKRDEIYRNLSLKLKQRMFAHIAAATFETEEYFLSQRDLEKRIESYLEKLPRAEIDQDIDGRAILKAIEAQHGIFVERAQRIYSFSHLTFQEYFTAKYIADNTLKGTLKRLINSHLTDYRWREVFLLTVNLLDEADEFFTLFRYATDDLIADDVTIIELLQWASQKATMANTRLNPAIVRSSYLFMAFQNASPSTFALAITHGLNRNNPAQTSKFLDQSSRAIQQYRRGLITWAECVFKHREILMQILEHDYNLDLGFDLDLHFALEMALGNIEYMERHDGIDVTAVQLCAHCLDLAIGLSQRINTPEFHQTLGEFSVPAEDASILTWKNFAASLREVMQSQRDVGHIWDLTSEQLNRIGDYLKANFLLIQCLGLSYVSDRQRIENHLLLPPEANKTDS